jgi:hypothetical protein
MIWNNRYVFITVLYAKLLELSNSELCAIFNSDTKVCGRLTEQTTLLTSAQIQLWNP